MVTEKHAPESYSWPGVEPSLPSDSSMMARFLEKPRWRRVLWGSGPRTHVFSDSHSLSYLIILGNRAYIMLPRLAVNSYAPVVLLASE